jgi:COX assembly protein 2
MHPHLAPFAHPLCADAIAALHHCHSAHPIRKFMGTCNVVRRELDRCLGVEFEQQRTANRARTDAEMARLKGKMT